MHISLLQTTNQRLCYDYLLHQLKHMTKFSAFTSGNDNTLTTTYVAVSILYMLQPQPRLKLTISDQSAHKSNVLSFIQC